MIEFLNMLWTIIVLLVFNVCTIITLGYLFRRKRDRISK